jgi:hypothetical protein
MFFNLCKKSCIIEILWTRCISKAFGVILVHLDLRVDKMSPRGCFLVAGSVVYHYNELFYKSLTGKVEI